MLIELDERMNNGKVVQANGPATENKFEEIMAFYVSDNRIEFVHKLPDNDDILKRRHDFVGQVNNVLCFFSTSM